MKNTAVKNAGKTREIDWRAFTIALVGGPFWGTLVGWMIAIPICLLLLTIGSQMFAFLLVPLWGIAFGAPAYLSFGAIAFALMARTAPTTAWAYALAGFLANLLSPLVFLLWGAVTSEQNAAEFARVGTIFGCFCAPIYGWGFGSIYVNLTKGS